MISNVGNEPTFLNRTTKELIDMIVRCTHPVPDLIQGWHVSDEPSLSEHRHIKFQITNFEQIGTCYRNPRRTVCDSFRVNLRNRLSDFGGRIRCVRDLDQLISLK